MTEEERRVKLNQLSEEVWKLTRDQIIVKHRFLDVAVYVLRLLPSYEIRTLATDGIDIFYHPEYILKSYKEENSSLVRYYLHILMHCIFRHFFVDTHVPHEYWNLACDIAVESVLEELTEDENSAVYAGDQSERTHQRDNPLRDDWDIAENRRKEIEKFQEKIKYMTAENICRYLVDSVKDKEELERLKRLFLVDDHSRWYLSEEEKNQILMPDVDGSEDLKKAGKEKEQPALTEESPEGERLKELWKNISTQMQVEFETFLKDRGIEAGGLVQNLRAVNRETYDYSEFLRKFAALGEELKVNDDEFDYIFYTYGLNLYGNLPLIEPLEYQEVKRVREFVIIIDTSGSTSGELVQKFVQKTYNVLKQKESFSQKVNLHIIQCDEEIQEDKKISTEKELDRYLEEMEIKGQGGTDFRPAFAYVDELVKNHEFKNLKGVIYFTDGFGEFPEKKPEYKTAIIYLEENYQNPEVPPWAIKLILRPEEIQR